jgi:hypothetical protein
VLYLQLSGAAAFTLMALPGWERERVSDALLLLTADPRPENAVRLVDAPGEAFEIWIGERRARYAVYKDGLGEDQVILVTEVI